MTEPNASPEKTRALRFHAFGEPADVLRLDEIPVPILSANHVRVVVHACGLNPADWALCRKLYDMELPRGIGTQHSLDPLLCVAPERHRQAQRRAPGLLEPHRRLGRRHHGLHDLIQPQVVKNSGGCGACAAEVTALREVSRRLASLTEPARSELERHRARRELIRRANEQIIGLDRPPPRWRLLAVVLLALCAGASIALGVRQAFRALAGGEAQRLAGE